MRREIRTTVCYAACHFCVDFSCAALLFSRVSGTEGWAAAALLYNFCAFALQMPIGLLADLWDRNRLMAAAGCGLVALSCVPMPALALSAIAGVGNALFHVGGGVDVLNLSGKKAGPLGVFVAPGALGLLGGTLLGKAGALPGWAPAVLMALCGTAILLLCRAPGNRPVSLEGAKGLLGPLLCLFLVVVLRSYTGFLFAFPWKTGAWAAGFVAAVALGKALGGAAADRFGTVPTAAGSLGAAALLFLFSQNALCGCMAACFFNMTMPLTLRLAADALDGARGFSFGLLTFGLFLGFAPVWLGLTPAASGWLLAGACLLSAALLLPAARLRAGR